MIEALRYAAFLAFPVGMAFAAASDLLTMTISNRLVLALGAAFVVLLPFVGMDIHTVGWHLATGGGVLVLAVFCFAMGWIGGGDAKFAAVIALWFGMKDGFDFLLLASLLGGGLTMLVLSFRGVLLPAVVARHTWVQRLHDPKEGVPYGIALAGAALAVYPHSIWTSLVSG